MTTDSSTYGEKERGRGEAERGWRGTAVGEGDGGSEDVAVASCFTRIFVFHLSIIQPRPSHLQFMNFAQSKSHVRQGGGYRGGGGVFLIKAFKEQKRGGNVD